MDIQQCGEDAIHVRLLVRASVASATSLRSFPNGFLEISVLSSLQPDQDGTKWLMTFRTHSQSWETFRYTSVTSISMLRSIMLHYTAAAFPWWSSRPPYTSAAWGQREPWVQLAALAATWCSAPRSGGPNPRKLCQDGARLKAHQLWDQGDMLDEMKHDNNDKPNQSLDEIKLRNLYVFVFICHIKLVQSVVHQ